MLVLIAIALSLAPAVFILWPFVFGLRRDEFEHDEGAPMADLARRWESAVAGLSGAELDYALETLSEPDYLILRSQLMSEAASIMRDMELSEDEEERMLAALGEELTAVRARVHGDSETLNAS